ncbi:Ryanodine receptor 2 [Ataeniobius toweri]|uniref:Ryanodine receptor 2 n=1 Tax=Ataeniobius toweri TaxID=208326 RepID=A0ABU7AU35_9TELE|nr:Ryanodine receptor 2 [Ataeniobius toweri]
MDECLTVPSGEHGEEQRRSVHYEGGPVSSHARSLWRLETLRVMWSGSHIRWGQPFRLRHVTTGKYLSLTEDKSLLLMDKEKADVRSTAFCFRSSKEKLDPGVRKEVDGMGMPDIKYGDSVCYIQHVSTSLWLTYQTVDAKCARMGGVQRKAIMHHEGHMDDGLTLSRSQHEESRTARVIRSTVFLFNLFIRGLDTVRKKGKSSTLDLPIDSVSLSLQDLIGYFQPPEDHLDHEDKQNRLRALKNRQNLFQEEGMISLVLECIDRLHVYSSAAHFAEVVGREAAEAWSSILNSLYQLLAALIRGNRKNCAQFSGSLDWLISRLERLEASSGILEVLHCVLVESPEALNIIKEGHIKSIISLLDKHGRNHKVVYPCRIDLIKFLKSQSAAIGTFHSQTEQSSGVCVSGTERGGVRQQLFLRTPQEGTHFFRTTINSLRSHVSKNHEHLGKIRHFPMIKFRNRQPNKERGCVPLDRIRPFMGSKAKPQVFYFDISYDSDREKTAEWKWITRISCSLALMLEGSVVMSISIALQRVEKKSSYLSCSSGLSTEK